jgi:hypothetical protein
MLVLSQRVLDLAFLFLVFFLCSCFDADQSIRQLDPAIQIGDSIRLFDLAIRFGNSIQHFVLAI